MIAESRSTHRVSSWRPLCVAFIAFAVVPACNRTQTKPAEPAKAYAPQTGPVAPSSSGSTSPGGAPGGTPYAQSSPRYGGGPAVADPGGGAAGMGGARMGPMRGMRGGRYGMAGVQTTPSDIPNGIALTFTTGPDRVAALQQRVSLMAERHNLRAQSGEAASPMPPGCRAAAGPVPPSTATATPLPNGARLDITANAPGDVEAVRQHVTARWQNAQAGQCPMMP